MCWQELVRRARLRWSAIKAISTHGQQLRQLFTQQRILQWLEQRGVKAVEGWPTKEDDFPQTRIFRLPSENKRFRTNEGMEKAIRQLWDELKWGKGHIPTFIELSQS